MAIEAEVGEINRDTSVGAVTVTVAEPVMDPDVAVIVAEPTATVVPRPVGETVMTVAEAELQNAELVRFCLLPSLLTPAAVNCVVSPRATELPAGETSIDVNVTG